MPSGGAVDRFQLQQDAAHVLPVLALGPGRARGVQFDLAEPDAGVTASLSGCSSSVPASGLATLRSSDLPFLRALIPVVLAGAVKAPESSVF